MEYIAIDWIHQFSDEPIKIYLELDGNREEIRKIELYINGNLGYATINTAYRGSMLSKLPVPELNEIARDSQFKALEINQEQFNEIWNEKVGNIE